MHVIKVVNVNDAWPQAKRLLNRFGVERPSRNGPMIEVPEPVATQYMCPWERVLFDPKRDCNPFFHFFEGLWMLAGRNDVAWVTQFNQRFMSYSDDGVTFHAAYGHRWRNHFGCDQLREVINMLKADPTDRRVVLQMWDTHSDLGHKGKDLPCNTAVYFKIRDGKLHMTVSNRSNDVVWGCYGANCVHMSMMQEYVAGCVGVDIGPYHQVSDSWHAYTEYWAQYGGLDETPGEDYYTGDGMQPGSFHVQAYKLVGDAESFDRELVAWMEEPGVWHPRHNGVFSLVATPMFRSYEAFKAKQYDLALARLDHVVSTDWRLACTQWLQRRQQRAEEKKKVA